MAVIKQQITRTEVDHETGETLKETVNETLRYNEEPAFIKVYLQDILYLSDMPKRYDKVLFELVKRAQWANRDQGMTITLSSGSKRLIAKQLGLNSISLISNALTDFVKAKILKRIETGVYALNPNLFGKGDWQDIAKLRLDVDYDLSGKKTFMAAIDYCRTEKNITPRIGAIETDKKEVEPDERPKE